MFAALVYIRSVRLARLPTSVKSMSNNWRVPPRIIHPQIAIGSCQTMPKRCILSYFDTDFWASTSRQFGPNSDNSDQHMRPPRLAKYPPLTRISAAARQILAVKYSSDSVSSTRTMDSS
jgi:hypothetical protein